jgi:tRNA (mo5U34)-methyltransferase
VDTLTDEQLAALNRLLSWSAFPTDARGRRFGNAAWSSKRTRPQAIPDRRILMLDERFRLVDKRVLEIGCFEGIHTVALAQRAREVIAIDARVENVVKTIVRAAAYGLYPTCYVCDVESRPLPAERLRADVIHHVGVLYHLADPVSHLSDLAVLGTAGPMLDTHFCADEAANRSYGVAGTTYRVREYGESGVADPFSGMSARSRWLRLEDLRAVLAAAGFAAIEVAEAREERNGPRVLLFARSA